MPRFFLGHRRESYKCFNHSMSTIALIIPVIPSSRWESTTLASFAAHPAARQKISGWNPHDFTSVRMDAYPIRHDISCCHSLLWKKKKFIVNQTNEQFNSLKCIYCNYLTQHEAHPPCVDISAIVGQKGQFVLESNAEGMGIRRAESTRFCGMKMRNGSFTWTPTSDRIGSNNNFV